MKNLEHIPLSFIRQFRYSVFIPVRTAANYSSKSKWIYIRNINFKVNRLIIAILLTKHYALEWYLDTSYEQVNLNGAKLSVENTGNSIELQEALFNQNIKEYKVESL